MREDERLGKIVLSKEKIKNRISELADEINADYQNKELIVVSILKSSLYFMADLTRKLDLPLKLDFLELSHSTNEDNTGVIRVIRDLEFSITGREILVIENIIKTGLTHSYLLKNLKARSPAGISICTLLNNTDKKLVELPIDYVGFEISEHFVVGYGLDYKEKYRNLPYIVEYNIE
ncbi:MULTISPECIES: hypoxanthine phosphoribosyltransferase [unclassified Halanaerobium]|uniref:hypoxanthine phosphoribosyltransferase n=1 Tax=unclassified Halanaerobium TaxID=2641197 RepID=UPI000DF4CA3D|nr:MULTISPECIES: hypoxanthine phosphoribosyltransferase [unclassified Halanaerobium]RCW46317.1 hypoxanthine phosphoribosyltransferase [Halanaerobium sp. MA284_MarDTE_T2]RCW84941.1 hypoxanthine phosphoribosyltransferase [Halanaerobium sp. DL-01]